MYTFHRFTIKAKNLARRFTPNKVEVIVKEEARALDVSVLNAAVPEAIVLDAIVVEPVVPEAAVLEAIVKDAPV